jgi:hypothetical protein
VSPIALSTVNERSKDMASNPIADAHEERAQSEECNGDSNDEQLGSHDFNPGLKAIDEAPCIGHAGCIKRVFWRADYR